MSLSTLSLRTLRCLAFLVCFFSLPLSAQHTEVHDRAGRAFDLTETGTVDQLGILVSVKPLLAGETPLGYEIGLHYKDPAYRDSPEVEILRPHFVAWSCGTGSTFSAANRKPDERVFRHSNARGVKFTVELVPSCKATDAGKVPFVAIEIRCSDLAKELHFLQAKAEGRLFDIAPLGYNEEVPTPIDTVLTLAETSYDVISTVLTVLDVVALSHGALTAGKFVLKVVEGVGIDAIVGGVFDYLHEEIGMRLQFQQTGWTITCRVCGRKFVRDSLQEGDLLRCENPKCPAEVILHFKN